MRLWHLCFQIKRRGTLDGKMTFRRVVMMVTVLDTRGGGNLARIVMDPDIKKEQRSQWQQESRSISSTTAVLLLPVHWIPHKRVSMCLGVHHRPTLRAHHQLLLRLHVALIPPPQRPMHRRAYLRSQAHKPLSQQIPLQWHDLIARPLFSRPTTRPIENTPTIASLVFRNSLLSMRRPKMRVQLLFSPILRAPIPLTHCVSFSTMFTRTFSS
mmetsp:Transcript_11046/g.41186  ORF Transcript_11046/g.41186 Transcript_11046/m.41186 type:complete len:212 (+) Transcript_11046:2674-3309(+)